MKKNMIRVFCGILVLCSVILIGACTPAENSEPLYVFTYNGTTIAVDGSAADVLVALGTWKQYSESPSCLFDGLDKIYGYSGFRIQTYPKDGSEYIYSVELLDDSVATSKGITIGSTRDAVIAAYGEGGRDTGSAIIYTDEAYGTELMISIRNDTVINIQYKKQTN
ncbi:MAG: hypothetical protein E7666_04080 [Ruminococcaceae bacterium]|nr:hypothetical protein [Oscillospiraceae bacterium]